MNRRIRSFLNDKLQFIALYKLQILQSIVLYFLLLKLFIFSVGQLYDGQAWKALMPGEKFGIPELERKIFGMYPVLVQMKNYINFLIG